MLLPTSGARRDELGKETAAVDQERENIRAKKERLGLAFADGVVAKEVYTGRLQKLSSRESELVKMSDNLDPETRAEIDDLEHAPHPWRRCWISIRGG